MAKAMSSRAIRELRERTRKEKHDKKRKVATRKVHLNYLIVCEGERTEPNYFRALVGGRNSRVLDVNILGEGQSTCRLVNTAIEEREKSMIEYDRVWVVFDKDDFTDFNEAIALANSNGIGAAWSNESFELWYYLHFQYLDTPITRAQYIDALNREIRKYEPNYTYQKNDKSTFAILNQYGNLEFAIHSAKRQESIYHDTNYAIHKPCTKVHHLVQELLQPEKVLEMINGGQLIN